MNAAAAPGACSYAYPPSAPAHRRLWSALVAYFVIPVRDARGDAGADRLERRRLGVPRLVAHMMWPRRARRSASRRTRRTRTSGCCCHRGVAAAAAMAAIVWELGPVKDMHGRQQGRLHLALVGATVLSAWAFIQVMFALHYAGAILRRGRQRGRQVRGGFLFPGLRRAGLGRVLLQAFVIGCACATADVNVTSTRDAPHLPHPGRRRVFLQHHHSRADDQHRRRADLSRRPWAMSDDEVEPFAPHCRAASSTATRATSPPPKR